MLTSVALGLPFRDSQCGLKVFRADVARRLFALRTVDGFGFDFEILTAALRAGMRVQRFAVRLTHDDDSRIDLVRDSLRMARDVWRVRRVCLKSDERNARSRRAIERLGAVFEGVRRSDMPAQDGSVRSSAYYSIVPAEWPTVRKRLEEALARS